MAYLTPKINWKAADCPVASDFNRIENNALANHDGYIAADLAEASARSAAVDAEEAARIAADAVSGSAISGIQAQIGSIDFTSGEYTSALTALDIPASSNADIGAGLWFFISPNDNVRFYIWGVLGASCTGMILADGSTHFKVANMTAQSQRIYYIKMS